MLNSDHGCLLNTISTCPGCGKMLLPTCHLQALSARGPSSLCLLELQTSWLLITPRGQIENTLVASIEDHCEGHMWHTGAGKRKGPLLKPRFSSMQGSNGLPLLGTSASIHVGFSVLSRPEVPPRFPFGMPVKNSAQTGNALG